MPSDSQQYLQIANAIDYFRRHQEEQPGLDEVASHVGLSEFYFQRLFTEWVGISPKKFLQYLTKEHAKQKLRDSSLLSVAYDVGLSGTGRLHDLMLSCEGVTPGQYKAWGRGLQIRYGLHDSPFGFCLLAHTDRGVCKCAFYDREEQTLTLIEELHAEWPGAHIKQDDQVTAEMMASIFPANGTMKHQNKPGRLHLLLKGSPFQLKVWEAVLRIPEGMLLSYRQLAEHIGDVSSTRAVASAVARNSVGYLIPCHRVIRSTGEFNQYRWGEARKQAIIGWEACQRDRFREVRSIADNDG